MCCSHAPGAGTAAGAVRQRTRLRRTVASRAGAPVGLRDGCGAFVRSSRRVGRRRARSCADDRGRTYAHASSLTAAIAKPGGGTWTKTIPPGDAPPPARFWWASAGKTFTAIVGLQLVEEKKLTLETTLDKFQPDFPNARVITIEHLLTHTSGLFSFQEGLALRKRAGYQPPDTLLGVAKRHAPGFCPGEAWAYSNTGYVLLGRIIEKIERQP
jgi:D-alanyl-D-alanine carboxypeptidase